MKKIIIVGGGFGGIKTALDLEKQNLPDAEIVLIHNKFHFEYHGALYRTVTGRSPLEICIPLYEIFRGKNVEVVEDEIVNISVKKEIPFPEDSAHTYMPVYTLTGLSNCTYDCDHLVLALGMQTNYFDIPGLKEYSFGFKTVDDALKLKRHLHEVFEQYASCDNKEKQVSAVHIVVVGAGASGVEASGDLVLYARKLARNHGVDPSLVLVDLVEAEDRILPMMSEKFSQKVEKQLRRLGVNVYTNRVVVKEDVESLYMKDMQMKTRTVVWTAGVRAHKLYDKLEAHEYDKQGRVMVDEFFQPLGMGHVYVIGDGAATKESGMAQVALRNASYIAEIISQKLRGKKDGELPKYSAQEIIYPIPVGPKWAGVVWGEKMFFGRVGWFLRRYFDFKIFRIFLPFGKAVRAFREGGVVCEMCPKCGESE